MRANQGPGRNLLIGLYYPLLITKDISHIAKYRLIDIDRFHDNPTDANPQLGVMHTSSVGRTADLEQVRAFPLAPAQPPMPLIPCVFVCTF